MVKPDRKSVLVIGAGIAGTVAARALSRYQVTVVDARPSVPLHGAVLHLRDPSVAKYLGVPVREVCVRKEVFYNGHLWSEPSIHLNNLYSLKLYGQLGRRSLNDLGEVKRWIIDGEIPELENCRLGTRVSSLSTEGDPAVTGEVVKAVFSPTRGAKSEYFDWIVSTAPMETNFKITGLDPVSPDSFGSRPIFFTRYKLRCISNVHQVIYFPDPEDGPVYRAAIDDCTLIIEGIGDISAISVETVLKAFGLRGFNLIRIPEPESTGEIRFGKISVMPEIERRANILRLTRSAKLFSFGRHAIWKPIRSDHLPEDIDKILKLMESTEAMRNYEQSHYQTKR